MNYHWKPLDIEQLRLYQVIISFPQHPQWNMVSIVAAKSPKHATSLIEKANEGTEWNETPIFYGKALDVYQPKKWSEAE